MLVIAPVSTACVVAERPLPPTAGAGLAATIRSVPYFICPNCQKRAIDHDRRDGLSHQPVGCERCGFGFLFELLEDYYPGPNTGFVVCDAKRRILAVGRGVFELTGFREKDLLGHEVLEAFGIDTPAGADPTAVVVEWGVRKLGEEMTLRTRAGLVLKIKADFFPAYDEDGGLLVALAPR